MQSASSSLENTLTSRAPRSATDFAVTIQQGMGRYRGQILNVSGSGGLLRSDVNEEVGNPMLLLLRMVDEHGLRHLLLRGIVKRKEESENGVCFGLQWTEATCDDKPDGIKTLLEKYLKGATGRITIERDRQGTTRPLYTFEFADKETIAKHALKTEKVGGESDDAGPQKTEAPMPLESQRQIESGLASTQEASPGPVLGSVRPSTTEQREPLKPTERRVDRAPEVRKGPVDAPRKAGFDLTGMKFSGMHKGRDLDFQLLHLEKEQAVVHFPYLTMNEGDQFAMKLEHPSLRRPIRLNARVVRIVDKGRRKEWEITFDKAHHRGVALEIEAFFNQLN